MPEVGVKIEPEEDIEPNLAVQPTTQDISGNLQNPIRAAVKDWSKKTGPGGVGKVPNVSYEHKMRTDPINQSYNYSSTHPSHFRDDRKAYSRDANKIYQCVSIYDQLVIQLKQLCASSQKDPAMKELAIMVLKLTCVWQPSPTLGTDIDASGSEASGNRMPAPDALTVVHNLIKLYNEDSYDTKRDAINNPIHTAPNMYHQQHPYDRTGYWDRPTFNSKYAYSAAHQPSQEDLECVVDRLEAIRVQTQQSSTFSDCLALAVKQSVDGLINVHITMERYIAQYCRMIAFSDNNEVTKLIFRCILCARKIKNTNIPVHHPNPCDDVLHTAASV